MPTCTPERALPLPSLTLPDTCRVVCGTAAPFTVMESLSTALPLIKSVTVGFAFWPAATFGIRICAEKSPPSSVPGWIVLVPHCTQTAPLPALTLTVIGVPGGLSVRVPGLLAVYETVTVAPGSAVSGTSVNLADGSARAAVCAPATKLTTRARNAPAWAARPRRCVVTSTAFRVAWSAVTSPTDLSRLVRRRQLCLVACLLRDPGRCAVVGKPRRIVPTCRLRTINPSPCPRRWTRWTGEMNLTGRSCVTRSEHC